MPGVAQFKTYWLAVVSSRKLVPPVVVCLQRICRIACERATGGGLDRDCRDGRKRADEGAASVPQLPLQRISPARFAGIDRGYVVDRQPERIIRRHIRDHLDEAKRKIGPVGKERNRSAFR